ncbi:hypothetical protein PUW25_25270 (plasmid) [Paenibacillus urinalis]|uniref:Uncharacterized protein n=1 Tax=Paenibacillus urinalis TaxID=521520 RepID=A0ABY7XGZ2_9BACL|nr:hypothetical protein [Paenibacillus urinalis]WDI05121.1 hypothetical protein PUW25_25270 [Paenibacillus urinalis]
MFKAWELVSRIDYDRRVNRKYGDGQWMIQTCWALYLMRWYEKYAYEMR